MKKPAIILVALLACFAIAEPIKLSTITFMDLASFEYQPEPPEEDGRIERTDKEYLSSVLPENVLSLNGQSIEVAGYMMPLSITGDKVREFLLLPNTMACCFGMMPAYNEFIFVKMPSGAGMLENVPIRVQGRFSIEETWEDGFFSHLYYMKGSRVEIGHGSAANLPPLLESINQEFP